VNLDYFVSDRIKIETNIALTYTKNNKNNGDLLSLAYRRMPNLSVYEQDRYGNDLDDYYSILPTVSPALNDQREDYNKKSIPNPVALAYQAKNKETSYNITPEFKLNYRLLGLDEEHTRLDYEGKVVFNIFNKYNDQYMPLSLSTKGWSDGESNKVSSNSDKSLGVTTTHTLLRRPRRHPQHTALADDDAPWPAHQRYVVIAGYRHLGPAQRFYPEYGCRGYHQQHRYR